jgi:hypothetical protein
MISDGIVRRTKTSMSISCAMDWRAWAGCAWEARAGAKSPFSFAAPGSVGEATHAGLPRLRMMRNRLGPRVHFRPFDGWAIPAGRSAITVPIAMAPRRRSFPRDDRDPRQHNAHVTAAWMRAVDGNGSLPRCLAPSLAADEQAIATLEGWMLGL